MYSATVCATKDSLTRLVLLSMKWNSTHVLSKHSTHFNSYRYRNVEAGCLSLQQSGREKQENLVSKQVSREIEADNLKKNAEFFY